MSGYRMSDGYDDGIIDIARRALPIQIVEVEYDPFEADTIAEYNADYLDEGNDQ